MSSSILLVLHCVVSLSSPSSSDAFLLTFREPTRELLRLLDGVLTLERAFRDTVLPLSSACLRRSRIFAFAVRYLSCSGWLIALLLRFFLFLACPHWKVKFLALSYGWVRFVCKAEAYICVLSIFHEDEFVAAREMEGLLSGPIIVAFRNCAV